MPRLGPAELKTADVPRLYPILSGVAGAVIPGLGHVVCGLYGESLLFFFAFAFYVAFGVFLVFHSHGKVNPIVDWLLLIPQVLLHAFSARQAYRGGMERARRESAAEPAQAEPPPEGPPVSMPVRVCAGIIAAWLLPNTLVLALFVLPFFYTIVLPFVFWYLAREAWSRGQSALALARGRRYRSVYNGWTGKHKTVPVVSLWDGVGMSTLGIFCWLMLLVSVSEFSQLMRKGNEGAGKGNVGSIRNALSIYYGDMEGQYPSDLASLTVAGKYLVSVPNARIPNYHSDSSLIREGRVPDDSGGWLYDNVAGDPNRGTVWVNCTHTDTRGTTWTSY